MPSAVPTPEWHARFAADRFLAVAVAIADRRRGAVVLQRGADLTLAAWDTTSDALTPIGVGVDGFADSWWLAADGRAVFRLADHDGDEHGHLERIPLDDPAHALDLTPGWAPYTLRGGAASLDGSTVAFTPIDATGFGLAVAPADGSSPARIRYRSESEAWHARLTADARFALLDTTDHNPGSRRFAVSAFDAQTGALLGRLADPAGGSMTAVCASPLTGDARVLVAAGAEPTGFTRPVVWDVETGESTRLDVVDPGDDVEVVPLDWSPDGRRLLLGVQAHATQRLLVHDLVTGDTTPIPAPSGNYWAPGEPGPVFGIGGDVLVPVEDADTPLRVVRCTAAGGIEPALTGPTVPPGRKARSVTFPSADGTVVQAWLIAPEGTGPFPAVVHAHGGPHWVVADSYNPEAQAWADEGFAYLAVNFRGSTGRGNHYARQIWGDVGRLELDDLAAGRRWLVEQGITEPGTVFLEGESYGGFLTLLGLGRQPDLWAGGFALVAIADWARGYREASPAMQAAFRGWFGGTPDERPELYRDRSPITYADAVRAPVVVVQGANDSRTAAGQMRAYERRMRELGKDITVHWFDAGHGYGGADDVRRDVERFVAAARRVLAGRPQPPQRSALTRPQR